MSGLTTSFNDLVRLATKQIDNILPVKAIVVVGEFAA